MVLQKTVNDTDGEFFMDFQTREYVRMLAISCFKETLKKDNLMERDDTLIRMAATLENGRTPSNMVR